MKGRFDLNNNTRRFLLTGLTIILLITGGMTVLKYLQPTQEQKEVPVYSFESTAGIDYQVFFSPNNFFPQQSAGPGQAYITPLTEYVEAHFNYLLTSDEPADIQGQYSATALLTGYVEKKQGEERIKVKAWEINNNVVPATPFSGQQDRLELSTAAPINIRHYTNFAETVAKEIRFSADVVELKVTYDIVGTVKTLQGETQLQAAPYMLIPIKGNSFMVEGVLEDKKEGSITEMQTVPIPGIEQTRLTWLIISCVMLILLVGTWVVTRGTTPDPLLRELASIFKKHGDRIVHVAEGLPGISKDLLLKVNSFENLVAVADEISQPILYEMVAEEIHNFYVIDDPLLYTYHPSPLLLEHDVSESIGSARKTDEVDF